MKHPGEQQNTDRIVGYVLICSIGTIVLLSLVGGLLTVADHLSGIHPVLSGVFYFALAAIAILGIGYPVFRIAQRPVFSLHKTLTGSPRERDRHCRLLSDNLSQGDLLTDEQRAALERMRATGDFTGLNSLFIAACKPRIDEAIKTGAKRAFFTGAISHGALVETVTMASISLDLVKTIVQTCGFRPTRPALIKLYVRVLACALVAGGVEDLELDELFTQAMGGGFGGKASGILLGGMTDGLVGAFLVFRIGVVTRDILLSEQPRDREEIRRSSYKDALSLMKSSGFVADMAKWIKSGAADMAKSAGSAVQDTVQGGLSRLVASAKRFSGQD